MTLLKTLAVAAAVAVGLMAVTDSASARRGGGGGGGRGGGYHGGGHHNHHHHRGSFRFWGGGFWGPGYWGAGYWPGYWGGGYWGGGYWGPGWGGYYGAPAIAYTPFVTQERVWVESDLAGATPPPAAAPNPNPNAQQWWYWCVSGRNYYPYVSSCAEGWQRVAPQPTPSAQ